MAYHSFEELAVWERGCDLAVQVYEELRDTREFAFRDQMIRSSLSIPSNIAEGAERGTDPDFIRFLYYSKGSSGELRTQAHVARRVGILTEERAHEIITETREVSAMLQGLIRSIGSKS
ncbi:MAG: four helix bundle protein [Akkermansiaceae bacterium]|nr:four helix bundle protein [Akkermansiaceae bacterium]